MKALIAYKLWLIKKRGGVFPEVGDKIKTLTKTRNIVNRTIKEIETGEESFYCFNSNSRQTRPFIKLITSKSVGFVFDIDQCFIEIDVEDITLN